MGKNINKNLIDAKELINKLKYIKQKEGLLKYTIDYFQLLSIIKEMMSNRHRTRIRRKK
jgi:hypothetical protein